MQAAYITPSITAFTPQGGLDLAAQGKLFDHLIDGGMDGILVLGSIGEFFALSIEDRRALAQFTVEYVAGRTQVLIGTGGMDAAETIALSNEVLEKGADGVVVISPYYFALDDAAVEAYYDRVARAVNGDVYLYNFPDRTGYDLSPAVTLRLLRKHRNIVGYKDTLAGSDHTRALIQAVKPEFPAFRIYCGFDDNFARTVLSGGDGCIGGLSNPFPALCAGWARAFREDDLAEVARMQRVVDRLMSIYGVGRPFVPFIKEAVRLCGVPVGPEATFPLPTPTQEQSGQIAEIIASLAGEEGIPILTR